VSVVLADPGYTVDDLDWLRDEIGVAHLELDPWGSLIVSPATDEHELAMTLLHEQALSQLDVPPGAVRSNGTPWAVAGGTGYLLMPDLMILAPGTQRVGELGFEPPPLLVVEIASPSTRRIDRGRKLIDYRQGGAGVYLLVDLPNTFEAHEFATGRVMKATGSIDLTVGGQPLRFTLPST